MNTTNLYREVILEHARKPRNFRRLVEATHSAEGINPLCGDKLRVYLQLDSNDTVVDASFEGSGCAISIASASLLTETVTRLTIADAEACSHTISERLQKAPETTAGPRASIPESLLALDGVREHPSRVKCATLAWQALLAALHNRNTATTE